MEVDKETLKRLRESNAWSQAHLAQVSGISLRTIQRIEKSGIASPESVKSLCATFGVRVNDLKVAESFQEEAVPTLSGLLKCRISHMDRGVTLIAFGIAFTIAFILTF
ncbi:putative Transcriptional regulator [Vibrio nigripulchritudo SOn1]|uniref:Transcriptional regulator n=1 Tax=Vibrio nigripulchritudo SOn1 TaxID=1238450 RepID=A0AAV2VRW8_9VIBR|nr:helix-turn-helix transcriptional regulator [Vibrio nigripulchritudo]CCO47210.1 putative Transcriptional regulator [Vibrio nigripulchritudo SOn1]